MFKVNNRNTRTNCEISSRFIRTAIEHIRISQLLLGVQSGTLNMYFQTGLNLTLYGFICKSNIYIFHILLQFCRDCPVRIICCIIPIPSKHLPIQTQQQTCKNKVWNVFSISNKNHRTTSRKFIPFMILNFKLSFFVLFFI